MAKENTDDIFYVGIRSPSDFRKGILLCSKGVITSLKRYEHLKELRKEKIIRLLQVQKSIKEISFLTNQLKSLLPSTKLSSLPVKKRKAVAKPLGKKKAEPAPEPSRSRKESELDKLEKELYDIESKLGRLD